MKKSKGVLINSLVVFGIGLTFFCLAALPFIMSAFLKAGTFQFENSGAFLILTGSLYALAVPFVADLFFLKKLCRLIYTEEALSLKSAACFRNAGIATLIEVPVFLLVQLLLALTLHFDQLLAIFWLPTFMVPLVCLVAGLVFLAMAQVFRKAAAIKEENDATF